MKMKLIGTVIAGTALLVVQAQAQNLIQNGSFETLLVPGVKVSSGFGGGGVPGWDGPAAGDTGVDVGTSIKAPGAFDGVNAAYFHQGDGWAQQTTAGVITSGQSYDLSFWTMNIDTYNGSWTGAGIGVISAEIYYGAPGSDIYSQVDFNLGPSTDGNTPGTWVAQNLMIPSTDIPGAAIGQDIGIKIWNSSGPDISGSWIYVDSVNLQAVPEPSTIALLGFGALGGLLALRRRHA